METTIDRAGRIVIPKRIREQAGLGPGAVVEIEFDDGAIRIRPAQVEVRVQPEGRFFVAVPTRPLPKLTVEAVEETRHALRKERG